MREHSLKKVVRRGAKLQSIKEKVGGREGEKLDVDSFFEKFSYGIEGRSESLTE